MRSRLSQLAVWALLCAIPALSAVLQAQTVVEIEFKDARVSIRAENATPRQILEEWARQGGTQVVNGEKAAGAPSTLLLSDVPELRALKVVLRESTGFVATARSAAPATGGSQFEKIVISRTDGAIPSAVSVPQERGRLRESSELATGAPFVADEVKSTAQEQEPAPVNEVRSPATGAVPDVSADGGELESVESQGLPTSPGVTTNPATGAPTAGPTGSGSSAGGTSLAPAGPPNAVRNR